MSPHTSKTVQQWLGYLFVEELETLKMLAMGLPDNPVIINIGAGGGTSCLAFKEARPDAYVITIDIQAESSPFGCLHGERTVMEGAGYTLGNRWFQIHGDSSRIGRNWQDHLDLGLWPKGKVNFVFVDGDHSYEGCKNDIEAWLPHLDGLIAVHDFRKHECYNDEDGRIRPHPQPWPGVDRAVEELLLDKLEQVMLVKSLIVFRSQPWTKKS